MVQVRAREFRKSNSLSFLYHHLFLLVESIVTCSSYQIFRVGSQTRNDLNMDANWEQLLGVLEIPPLSNESLTSTFSSQSTVESAASSIGAFPSDVNELNSALDVKALARKLGVGKFEELPPEAIAELLRDSDVIGAENSPQVGMLDNITDHPPPASTSAMVQVVDHSERDSAPFGVAGPSSANSQIDYSLNAHVQALLADVDRVFQGYIPTFAIGPNTNPNEADIGFNAGFVSSSSAPSAYSWQLTGQQSTMAAESLPSLSHSRNVTPVEPLPPTPDGVHRVLDIAEQGLASSISRKTNPNVATAGRVEKRKRAVAFDDHSDELVVLNSENGQASSGLETEEQFKPLYPLMMYTSYPTRTTTTSTSQIYPVVSNTGSHPQNATLHPPFTTVSNQPSSHHMNSSTYPSHSDYAQTSYASDSIPPQQNYTTQPFSIGPDTMANQPFQTAAAPIVHGQHWVDATSAIPTVRNGPIPQQHAPHQNPSSLLEHIQNSSNPSKELIIRLESGNGKRTTEKDKPHKRSPFASFTKSESDKLGHVVCLWKDTPDSTECGHQITFENRKIHFEVFHKSSACASAGKCGWDKCGWSSGGSHLAKHFNSFHHPFCRVYCDACGVGYQEESGLKKHSCSPDNSRQRKKRRV
ncbi:hypothetical protein EV361DRAFT_410439 [Lentinula raphanica]|nr:hypothetical protein EV361DRAFT_410439 [Lentinula raphanica]